MTKTYWHFDESERRRISRLLEAGESKRSIAKKLGRSPSNVCAEIRRNSVRGVYDPRKAQNKSIQRRKQSKLQSLGVLADTATRDYVEKKLKTSWSPELISGRLRRVHQQKDAPSTKAVYKFVHSVYGRTLEKFLPSKQWKRKGGPKRGARVHLDGRHMINDRPAKVEKRKEFSHFEMDFIESGKDGNGSLLVLTERMSRYPFLVYTASRKTEHINKLVAETLRDVPVLSITTDNDISFQKHEELSAMLGTDIFFCDPYSSWQKGTVENRNGAVRKQLPKRTDLSMVTKARIMAVEHWLRHRPMKVLEYLTPFEVWHKKLKQWQQKRRPVARGMMVEVLKVNETRCST